MSLTSVPPSFIAYAIVVNVDNLRMTLNFQCLTIFADDKDRLMCVKYGVWELLLP